MAETATSIEIAKELVISCEGLNLEAYICNGGEKTIGYGHVIKKYEHISQRITEAQANQLLERDLQIALAAVRRYCKVPLSLQQEAVLISFAFNCGSGALQASTLRQKLRRGEYELAANELLKWVYAGGLKRRGLVKRRILERNLFLLGTNNG